MRRSKARDIRLILLIHLLRDTLLSRSLASTLRGSLKRRLLVRSSDKISHSTGNSSSSLITTTSLSGSLSPLDGRGGGTGAGTGALALASRSSLLARRSTIRRSGSASLAVGFQLGVGVQELAQGLAVSHLGRAGGVAAQCAELFVIDLVVVSLLCVICVGREGMSREETRAGVVLTLPSSLVQTLPRMMSLASLAERPRTKSPPFWGDSVLAILIDCFEDWRSVDSGVGRR